MTSFWLIRHGSHDWLGKTLVGRRPGIHLNQHGRTEAEIIARRLADVPLAALYVSPMERTLQTAKPVALTSDLRIQIEPALNEVDFGKWTGLSFEELASNAQWEKWNRERSRASTPEGETMQEVQARAIRACEHLAKRHDGEDVALVSHGDVLRAILLHVLGLSLDLIHTIEFSPGAVALVDWHSDFACLRQLQSNSDLLPAYA